MKGIIMTERITLEDSLQSTVVKMVEGNPGAMRVCCDLIKENAKIDPDSMLGELSAILALDSNGIYGSKIWMLYSDVCECNIITMIGLLRACQLGYLSNYELRHGINNYGEGIAIEEMVNKVKAQLPKFGKETND